MNWSLSKMAKFGRNWKSKEALILWVCCLTHLDHSKCSSVTILCYKRPSSVHFSPNRSKFHEYLHSCYLCLSQMLTPAEIREKKWTNRLTNLRIQTCQLSA